MSIDRNDPRLQYFKEILDAEAHHDHEIVDNGGTFAWKRNDEVNDSLRKISLNDLIPLLHALGYNKNSEVYRKLYRDMGYSLDGYWEIFYWEVNNPIAREYAMAIKGNIRKIKIEDIVN